MKYFFRVLFLDIYLKQFCCSVNISYFEICLLNYTFLFLVIAFEMGIIQFPSVTDVNTRVRRLVTAFQRNNKRLEIRNAQKAKVISFVSELNYMFCEFFSFIYSSVKYFNKVPVVNCYFLHVVKN